MKTYTGYSLSQILGSLEDKVAEVGWDTYIKISKESVMDLIEQIKRIESERHETKDKLHRRNMQIKDLKIAKQLLNEISETATDLTPMDTKNEKYAISGKLFSEVYNYLINRS